MPKSPNLQTNNNTNTNKSNTINKNQTNIQEARLTNKRNLSSSSNSASEPSTPKPSKNIILTNHKKKIFVTRNRFETLSQDDLFETTTAENISNSHQTNTNNTDAETLIKPPPPIFVKGIEDYPELCTTLIELIGVDNFMCKSTTNSLQIQTTNPSAYKALIQFLKSEKAEYHTYQLKEDKPLRVVIRNLHSSTPLTLIKEELEVRCFEVRQVTNVSTFHSKEIFQLSSLLHCTIKVEEPYKQKTISQCFNCQQYGRLLWISSSLCSLWSGSSVICMPEPTRCPSEMRPLFPKPPSQLQRLLNI